MTPMAPRIELVQGDITTESVDAIVNAANTGVYGYPVAEAARIALAARG